MIALSRTNNVINIWVHKLIRSDDDDEKRKQPPALSIQNNNNNNNQMQYRSELIARGARDSGGICAFAQTFTNVF